MSRRGRVSIALSPKTTRSLYSVARKYNLSLSDLLAALGTGTRLKRRDR